MSKSHVLLSPPAGAAVCGDPASGCARPLPSGVAGVACCAPLSRGALSPEQADQVAPLLKALGDPVRLRLMSLVASRIRAARHAFDLAGASTCPSRPSATLKVLHDSGLLDTAKPWHGSTTAPAPRRWPASAP